jgi:transcriptional regulator with GAF, ATPase, and Fis domain
MTETLKDKIQEIEREEIVRALKECEWIMARAARKLGITERMIAYKVKKYGISKQGRRQRPEFEEINYKSEGGLR